jgi:hypothetical protein
MGVVLLAHVTQAGRRAVTRWPNVKHGKAFFPLSFGAGGLRAWRIDGMPATPLDPTFCTREHGPDIAMRLFLPWA